jgi:hypothetical protein
VRVSLVTLFATAVLFQSVPVYAQHEHHQPAPADGAWLWSADATGFLTGNLQVRKFRDFHQVESQNWFMGGGARRLGEGSFSFHAMFSLEPFTLRRLGSAQVFQTGETLDSAPLIDYQHPHDLFMGLSTRYSRDMSGTTVSIGGGLVDSPALGPTPFMHRESASLHPTAPLGHHQYDSTHITHGVITAGIGRAQWRGEASVFRGREPDENRTDLDLGALDSWSTRLTWQRAGVMAQVSGAQVHEPETYEPGDLTKLSASVEFTGTFRQRPAAATVVWGRNHHANAEPAEHAFLAEVALGLSSRTRGYLRGELVDKHILEARGHGPAGAHVHIVSRIGALTAGLLVDLTRRPGITMSIGGDVSGYRVPTELSDPYGQPVSVHFFLRVGLQTARAREEN